MSMTRTRPLERAVTLVIYGGSAASVTLPPRIVLTGSTGALEVVGERTVLPDGQGAIDMFVPDSDIYDRFAPQHAFATRRLRRRARRAPRRHKHVHRRLGLLDAIDRLFAAKA